LPGLGQKDWARAVGPVAGGGRPLSKRRKNAEPL